MTKAPLTGDKYPSHVRGSDPALAGSSLGITSTAEGNLGANQITGQAHFPPSLYLLSIIIDLSELIFGTADLRPTHPSRVFESIVAITHVAIGLTHSPPSILSLDFLFVYSLRARATQIKNTPSAVISVASRVLIMKDLAVLTHWLIVGAWFHNQPEVFMMRALTDPLVEELKWSLNFNEHLVLGRHAWSFFLADLKSVIDLSMC